MLQKRSLGQLLIKRGNTVMKRKQNMIIFSAGESVRNGKLDYLKKKLGENNIHCYDWRELFENAHDAAHIALLPSLSKKIPTFDFALVFAEGVDSVQIRGEAAQKSMRDNVLFELGLCVMALGTERVILFAEDSVHIPDDLIGIGKIGVKYVSYAASEFNSSVYRLGSEIEKAYDKLDKSLRTQIDSVIEHIKINADIISPVFIGAAVSSAEAYFFNFIIRLLENLDKGIIDTANNLSFVQPIEKVRIKILLPTIIDKTTRDKINEYYEKEKMSKYHIKDAVIRGLDFKGMMTNGELTVNDIPTSVTASYSVVNSILNIDSDDEYDLTAEKRFVTKEIDVYAYTLKKLLLPEIAAQRLYFIKDENKKAKILDALKRVEVIFVEM